MIDRNEYVELVTRSAVDSLEQTAVGLLALGPLTVQSVTDSVISDEQRMGASIPLWCDSDTLQMALLVDNASSRHLSAAMLIEEPDSLTDHDVSDAMGEILNVAGGILEEALNSWHTTVDLGLPVVFEGRLVLPHDVTVVSANVLIDDIPAELVLLLGTLTQIGVGY